MALLHRPLIVDGETWGTIFTLEQAGDRFPVHTHGVADNHITVLAHGSVRCIGHERFDGLVLEAVPGGTIVNWREGEPHGFVAISDGATLVNILKRRGAP